jgi:predicted O-methyltransferase YrrM
VSRLHQAKAYITYWFCAVDDHALHSPFLFDFYHKALKGKPTADHQAIEKERALLLADNRIVSVHDFGSGSTVLRSKKRCVRDIARTSLTPSRYAQFYDRLANYLGARRIAELGTSLGITALYLANNNARHIRTFEGSPALAAESRTLFTKHAKTNIELIEGDIDQTLPEFIAQCDSLDMVLMDANHTFEATQRYFELLVHRLSVHGVIVIDDIHLTPAMEKAWAAIRRHPMVTLTLDLFRCGVVFINQDFKPQHFVLRM